MQSDIAKQLTEAIGTKRKGKGNARVIITVDGAEQKEGHHLHQDCGPDFIKLYFINQPAAFNRAIYVRLELVLYV